jgi:diaminopimelate epimerase
LGYGDGLILLENDPESDFKMVYYNSDGSQSTMCGNGGRCLVAFAKKLKTIGNSARFNAVDGLHHATIKDDGIVSLQMIDVLNIKKEVDYTFLDTGSPSCSDSGGFRKLQCKEQGSAIRYSELYGKQGSINFVKKIDANTFRCAPMKEAWKMNIGLWNGCDRCCNSDECHGSN